MRFCTRCRRLTPGDPLYCNACGSSYNVKLCPRSHVNPREAEVCSTCGSRDLSLPAPKPSLLHTILVSLASWLPLVLLALLALASFATFLDVLLRDQRIQLQLLLLVLLFSFLTFLYSKLPKTVRRLIRASLSKARKSRQNRKKKP